MEEIMRQVNRLDTEQVEMKRRLDKLEINDERHEEDIRQLYAHQEGTKAYVNQILQKLDSLETKLFNALSNTTANNLKERQGWMELFKYVITATIGAVIFYLFQ
ncbi:MULTISPECIES: hypothetical protein [Chengkuizengella]|uniref:hypothetical protein n=1 Tax=Chengkuizengella TaxID=2026172 RepID=UPI001389C138|nr:hypothetical protein [Chengkuizengella sediminis]NDI37192.1 hypothetical protein [Chengkuizengella sediminis]